MKPFDYLPIEDGEPVILSIVCGKSAQNMRRVNGSQARFMLKKSRASLTGWLEYAQLDKEDTFKTRISNDERKSGRQDCWPSHASRFTPFEEQNIDMIDLSTRPFSN